jgi:hypothetical protein
VGYQLKHVLRYLFIPNLIELPFFLRAPHRNSAGRANDVPRASKGDDVFTGCENNATKGNHPFFRGRLAYYGVSLLPDFNPPLPPWRNIVL